MLSKHAQAEGYAHFGTELSDEVAGIIDAGTKLRQFFSQPPFFTVPRPVQLVMGALVWQGWMNGETDEAVGQWRDRLVQHYTGDETVKEMIDAMIDVEELPDFLENLRSNKERIVKICQSEMISKQK